MNTTTKGLFAAALIAMSSLNARLPDTYNVDSNGGVSKGAAKEETKEPCYFKGHIWSEDGCSSMNMPGVNSIILR